MFGNAIKQTTTTTGTGNLTLSSVSGYPTLNDVFGTKKIFAYSLLDSNGLFLEAGLGYLSNSTTLVRSRVTATFSGGTYTTNAPSALSLSGTTTVLGTPVAGSIVPTFGTIDSVSSGTRQALSAARCSSFTAQALVANRLCYVPFLLAFDAVVTSLNVNVTIAAASSYIRTGIYACRPDGYIGDLLLTHGTDIDSTTTGFKTASVTSTYLPAGWYYIGLVASGGTPTITCYTSAGQNVSLGSPMICAASTLNQQEWRHETLSAGAALPTTPNATTTGMAVGSTHPPAVALGI